MPASEPQWSPDERASLLASVGGGAHVRPLTPAAVGALMAREAANGVSHDEMARSLHLESAAMIGRFIRVATLPSEVGASVGWGRSARWINLTQAHEIARLATFEEQRELARLVLEYRLSGAEVRGAVQICLRRGVPVGAGVEETIRLRPTVERRYVQIGSLTRPDVLEAVGSMDSVQRLHLMAAAVEKAGIAALDVSLNERSYVLVVDPEQALQVHADVFEVRINDLLAEIVGEG